MSFSDDIPKLGNTIGADVPLIADNTDHLKACLEQEHSFSDSDATACIHTTLMKPAYGLLAARPATGKAIDWYYATDARVLYYGTGTGGAWNELKISGSGTYVNHAETVSTFTLDGGRYYCDITHSFGAAFTYIISDIRRYVTDTWYDANSGKETDPQTNDILRFWFDTEPESIKVALMGMGE